MKRLFLLLPLFLLFFSNNIFAQATDLIISEYIEGSSNNKSIEIYNGTGSTVDLSNYEIWVTFNGANWADATKISLNGSLVDGDIYVVSNSSASSAIKSVTDKLTGSAQWNGNDAVGLVKNDVLIDAVGEDGSDPGTGWDVADNENATANHTLVRKSEVCSPNTDWDDSRGTNASNSEWIVYPIDTFTYLGSHSSDCSSSVANPSNFNATAVSTTQIDLSWILNGSNDDVMVAYNSSSTFGTPADGTSYSIGNPLPGGEGDIIYIGNATSFNHTGLTPGTQYFYKVWSFDGSTNYSTGVIDDATTFTIVHTDLIISEVADPRNPEDPDNEKFIEIYNLGSSAIDFGTSVWYMSRQANAGSWYDIQLTGVINAGETYVMAYDALAFSTAFSFSADQVDIHVSGNGNDVYALYSGGDHMSGILIDIYGEINVNGFHTAWDYKDSKAVRKKSVTDPNTTWNAAEWVIIPADIDPPAINELTPGWHNKDLNWTGNSSNWADASNWNDGGSSSIYAPDAGCNITISGSAANDAVVYRRASCNEMIIESGAVVTINSQPDPSSDTTACFLVTGGTITNSAGTSGLIVKSDANGDGAFILGSGTTVATIERYLIDDRSHLISAPITDATANNLFQNHNPEVYLYEHHEEDDTWQYLVPTSTPMLSGQGFSTWVDDATPNYITANFDGNLTSSDLTLNSSVLSYTSDEYGWNLIGNPFSAPLDWDKGDWDTTNVEGTVWVWDPVLDDYRWRNAFRAGTLYRGIIPMGQAFFVRAQNDSPLITIPANARSVHTKRDYYKGSNREQDSTEYLVDHVMIYAQNNMHTDEVWISFSETGTDGFDNGWDVTKVKNTNRSVNVFVPKEIRNQCLEHLPTLLPDEERIVEMNFETTLDGEHSLAIDMTYLPNTNVILEDLKYNQMQDMKYDSIYSFVGFTDDDPNRFRIHFNKTTTGIEFQEFDPKTDQSVQIYSHEKNIYIKKEDLNSSGYVMVYDLYGREVLSQPLENTSLMKIPLYLNNTYLIVKVISDNKVVTSKVYIR